MGIQASRASTHLRVILVDDHPLIRQGLRRALEQHGDLEVIGEAADGQAALDQVEMLAPEVVVCDLSLPDLNGLEVTRAVRRQSPRCAVVILTASTDDEQLFAAIRAGAAAFATKDSPTSELADLIRAAGRGEYRINDYLLARPMLASRVLDEFRHLRRFGANEGDVFSPLTPRELEILEGVARGGSNKEVAAALTISDQTVKNHLTSILRKLAVNDRTQAVLYALRRGWIALPEGAASVGPPGETH
jgi:DNA-binding NarL/FixJ family response regulator